MIWVRLFFVGGRISLRGGEAGGNQNPSRGGEGAAGTGDRWYLCSQRRLGGVRWYSRAWWKVSVRINTPAARGGLRTVATAAKCHCGPGRLPSGRGPKADRPFNELATSTARRIAAATWIMSSTTCGFQGVRGGAREAVAMVTWRRISTKERSGSRFSAASSGCRPL